MGLFGFVKRAIGGIAKAGLGVVSGGMSNQIFDYIDARKRQQHLQPIADQYFDIKPKIKGGYKLKGGLLGYREQMEETGETPGERQERKRAARMLALRKAQAKRKAKDLT